ncbi:hypothetical protein GS597_01465 [Synechococcales cyanobacterium C]|uniref:Uncharacterized protein n=1 Tax=Petrachloros mirabilis ULC683 TaxID=2781853 RepID=A0A8K2ANA8_9CYAN|nr:hypothetical protein [Petrachloros mirabilis]NCJ05208.1 hypothetical protein [Petrachloros mirabilis ULC683]
MLSEWIQLSEDIAGIQPVAFAYLPNLESMFSIFQSLCDLGEVAKADAIAQRILDLHERVDRPGHYGVEIKDLAEGEFERLFVSGGAIEQLNRLEVSDAPKRETDEFPPWSSGDYQDDWLADLMHSLNSFSEANALLKSRSIQSVSNLLRRLADLSKGAKGRAKQQLNDWFWDEYMASEDSDWMDAI